MFGELTPDEIDVLLREEIVARIAYIDRRGLPCIAPINYVDHKSGRYATSEISE
jgi:nitroimidazol reductase NimA-like FMN-containing flavoprotein (pyridoxamine 5'-phosphate oxidase superfamily)